MKALHKFEALNSLRLGARHGKSASCRSIHHLPHAHDPSLAVGNRRAGVFVLKGISFGRRASTHGRA